MLLTNSIASSLAFKHVVYDCYRENTSGNLDSLCQKLSWYPTTKALTQWKYQLGGV